PQAALAPDAPPLGLYQPPAEVEPDPEPTVGPGARPVDLAEALEDHGDVPRVDARSLVGHRDLDLLAPVDQLQDDGTVGVLAGVVQQVVDHLLEPAPVDGGIHLA